MDQSSSKKKKSRTVYGIKRINKGCMDKIMEMKEDSIELGDIFGWVIISGYIEEVNSNDFILNDTTGIITVDISFMNIDNLQEKIIKDKWVTLYGYFLDDRNFSLRKIQDIKDINEFIYHMVVSLAEFYALGEGIDVKRLNDELDKSITPEMYSLLDLIKEKSSINPNVDIINDIMPELKKTYRNRSDSEIIDELNKNIQELEMIGLIFYSDSQKKHISVTLK